MLFLTEYRIIEGYDYIYDKKIWQVQRRYKHLNSKGEFIHDWTLIYYDVSKKRCEDFLEKHKTNIQKNYIDF